MKTFSNLELLLGENPLNIGKKNTTTITTVEPPCQKRDIMNNKNYLDVIRSKLRNNEKILVKLFGFWASSESITEKWKKMSKDGMGNWENISLTTGKDYDIAVVINCPPINEFVECEKIVLVRMEPNMHLKEFLWGEWSNPDDSQFIHIFRHEKEHNTIEWHIDKTFTQLSFSSPEKDEKLENRLSAVLSEKYSDPGHVKRIDFVKFLEKKGVGVDVFGSNKFSYVNYKGSLPYHAKDDALLPYKYTFNCENNSIKNYVTEKLIDGILSETLVFYSGCPNIRELIDDKAYVYLELSNFEKDYEKIKTAIQENWWEQRLPYIRKAKKKILNEMQFFPCLEKTLKNKV